jgi:hypothetical protein
MFSVIGRLSNKSYIKTGVSEKGAWKIISFLIQKTRKRKPIKIPIIAKGKLAEKIESIAIGEKLLIQFYIEGKKFNNKYYTDCIATEIDKYVPKSKIFVGQHKDDDFEFTKDNNLFQYNKFQ